LRAENGAGGSMAMSGKSRRIQMLVNITVRKLMDKLGGAE